MSNITEAITKHKLNSADVLKDQQIAYIPTVDSDQVDYSCSSYLVDGNRNIINISCQACLKLKYLKLQPMPARKYIKYQSGIWTMPDLVSDKVVCPFLLFINGIFIPWETISIAMDQEQYYIVIDLSANDYEFYDAFIDTIRDIKYAQTILLPNYTMYTTGVGVSSNLDVFFSFDYDGRIAPNRNGRFKFVYDTEYADRIYCDYITTESLGITDVTKIYDDTSVKLTSDNAILFVDNMLATGEIHSLRKAFDSEHKNEDGSITPCLKFVSNKLSKTNPFIHIDSGLASVYSTDAFTPYEHNGNVTFAIFINKKSNKTVDNVSKLMQDKLSPIISYTMDINPMKQPCPELTSTNPISFMRDLRGYFKMKMSRNKKYDENVSDCIKTMLAYDSSLFNSVYKENSNLVIEEHDGKWLLDKMDLDGTARIPRLHSEMIDEYIVMLVNGEMYRYYRSCYYYANEYVIPIQSISPEDIIEFLRFQNVCNAVTDIVINKDDGFKNLSPELINNDMVLFSPVFMPDESKGESNIFDFPPLYDPITGEGVGLQHFPVSYTLETDENGLIKIILDNEKYYGQKLKVAYRNRFKHFWYNLQETTDKYTVDLGDKFMYCNDYSKYMVFYNGRRLTNEHYKLTLPVRPTTPFYNFNIYLTLPMHEGDRLDIIYVPSLMQDVYSKDDIIMNDITIDKKLIEYCLSTDLYIVWLNGKKIPKSHIADIASSSLAITEDEKTRCTLAITKYIPSIDELSSVFNNTLAKWDKIVNSISVEELYNLMGIDRISMSGDEGDIYSGAIDSKAIMFELIREQYMMNPNVDITGPFVYDYQDADKSAIVGYDSDGNAILPTADSNRTDNLSNVTREWP